MYKDVLERLNKDRIVDTVFIKRLEKNGFKIEYGKYSYWDNQEYITIGESIIWLVEQFDTNYNSFGCRYRRRNEVAIEIKKAIERENKLLDEQNKLIDEILD